MSIGYACLALGVLHSNYRTVRLSNLNDVKLKELIEYNIESFNRIIDYNIKNEIYLFRISSSLIPFGISSINHIKWWKIFEIEFKKIGIKIKKHNIRVSMHPGQYTVLNSPNEEIVKRSIDDLVYHSLVLDCLQVDDTSKIVLHIGGAYGNKQESINRFVENFYKLPLSVKKRLIIENDDRIYNIEDVLKISEQLSIPVVFDNLHNFLNPPLRQLSDKEWISLCNKTWKKSDGKQKVHYSEQDRLKQPGAHSFTINLDMFLNWYNKLGDKDLDIMLEVKDKNISAIKISHCTKDNINIHLLIKEWDKYKYKVLEHSPEIYLQIIELFKDKKNLSIIKFYRLIELSLNKELYLDNQVNALLEIWNCFKNQSNKSDAFLKRLDNFKNGTMSLQSIKNYLYNLALKDQNQNLINSYYFAF